MQNLRTREELDAWADTAKDGDFSMYGTFGNQVRVVKTPDGFSTITRDGATAFASRSIASAINPCHTAAAELRCSYGSRSEKETRCKSTV